MFGIENYQNQFIEIYELKLFALNTKRKFKRDNRGNPNVATTFVLYSHDVKNGINRFIYNKIVN